MKLITLLFFCNLIFFALCNGQVKTNLKQDNIIEQKTIPSALEDEGIVDLEGYIVRCGLKDKTGNIWFGTTGKGLFRYNGKYFTNFTTKNGLCNNTVYSILEDTFGKLWFGTSAGVSIYDGKTFASFTIPQSDSISNSPSNNVFSPNMVVSILQDKRGNIWFGTFGYGVYCYDGTTFTNFLSNQGAKQSDGLYHNVIQCMLEDKSGAIWFGSMTHGGVSRYDGKGFTYFTTKDGLCDNQIFYTLEDRGGNIWFGTRDGAVCRYNGKFFTSFPMSNNCVSVIFEDKNENLWFGCDRGTLCRYDGKSFTNFTTKESKNNNRIWTIVEDNNGAIWFGSRRGDLSLYDGKSFINLSDELK
ncbi:MAG: two-component regulator propeller domain-containing protein [Chitinophagaceae bacterium]|jgi:ligand-binding sensor domain-containing protein